MEDLHKLVSQFGLLLVVLLGATGGFGIVWAGAVRWLSPPGPERLERVRRLLILAAVFLLMAILVFVVRNRIVGWVWG